ncbi:MAG: hypothetical protein H6924_09305 [Alphaproteobacteria bacterium]|nr:hypothetical protein [Alphaproteobacteria bacterium]
MAGVNDEHHQRGLPAAGPDAVKNQQLNALANSGGGALPRVSPSTKVETMVPLSAFRSPMAGHALSVNHQGPFVATTFVQPPQGASRWARRLPPSRDTMAQNQQKFSDHSRRGGGYAETVRQPFKPAPFLVLARS